MSAGVVLALALAVAMFPLVVWASYEAYRQYLESKDNHHGG